MTRFVINAYKRKSRSARALARALQDKFGRGGRVACVKDGDPYDRTKLDEVVINWGNGDAPSWFADLNKPEAVRLASNKLRAFRAMQSASVPIPLFASEKRDVNWKGITVIRNKLQGHSGEGIEIYDDTTNLPDAPLYVQYIKKEQEFRIHVGRVNGESKIIAVQRKARDLSVPDEQVNWQVRNHVNGFIFAREGANPNDDTLRAACDALRSLGLDFGAIDIVWNQKEGKPYVLEINTAPGLEGQTITDYAEFFKSI